VFFGIVDGAAFLSFSPDLIIFAPSLNPVFGIHFVVALLNLAMWLSFAFSSYGLIRRRRWAVVLSYVQFPFRFYTLQLSFWYLNFIPRLIGSEDLIVYRAFLGTCMVLECARLGVTIYAHRGVTRWSEPRVADAARGRSP
jgi:hypothetical protein